MPPLENLDRAAGNHREPRLAGRRAREIRLRPSDPGAHALIFGKPSIRGFDGGSRCRVVIRMRRIEKQGCAWLGIRAAIQWNDHAISNRRVFFDSALQILRINIKAGRRNDHALLAPAEAKIASGVEFTEVSGAEPAVIFARGLLRCTFFPVGTGNVFAADQDFAVLGEFEFAAGKNFSNRAFRCAERMVEADQRRGFGHSVALNDGVTHALEEILGVIRKRRTAGDERPEFPAEAAMNAAKHPGTPEEFPALRAFERALEPERPATDFHFAIGSRAQRIEHARNGDQRGGAFTFYGSNDFRWICGRFENNRGAQQRWNQQRHELAKNMAQWNEGNKAQGMEPALVLAVG